MQLIGLLIYLCVIIFCTTVKACPRRLNPPQQDLNHASDKSLAKRWYGVKSIAGRNMQGLFGPWPVHEYGEGKPSHGVRYCFKDARSQKNLDNVVKQAVDKWKPAMVHSSLVIVPDNEKFALCSDYHVQDDALVISDETKDHDHAWNYGKCVTASSGTGYHYVGNKQRGRHTLEFCNLDPDDPKGTEAKAVRTMMHELGHAIGLQQDKYITFRCDKLEGYQEGLKEAKFDVQAYFDQIPESDMDARMRVVCNDDKVSDDYLPSATPFLRGDLFRLQKYTEQYGDYEMSTEYDYNSIMTYSSADFTPDGTNRNDPKNWVLIRKDGGPVLMGGDADPAKVKISEGDVARVTALYHKDGESSFVKHQDSRWGSQRRPKLRARLGGLR